MLSGWAAPVKNVSVAAASIQRYPHEVVKLRAGAATVLDNGAFGPVHLAIANVGA